MAEIEAGKFYEMSNREYHFGAGVGWESKSSLANLLDSPRDFWWSKLEKELDVFDKEAEKFHKGTAGHTWFLEPDKFHDQVEEIQTFKGKDSQAARWKWQDSVRASGKLPISAKYLVTLANLTRLLDSGEHETARKIIYNKDNFVEQAGFWIDPDTGLQCKTKIDILAPDMVEWDLKFHNSLKPFFVQADILHYDLQAAMGLAGANACTTGLNHERFGFIVFHVKQAPYDIEVVEAPPEFIESGKEKFERCKYLLRHCQETGQWPGKYPDRVEMMEITYAMRKRLEEGYE